MKQTKFGTLTEPPHLVGAKVKIIRKSNRTGALTVEFIDGHKAYKPGDTLNIMPYEFRPQSGESEQSE